MKTQITFILILIMYISFANAQNNCNMDNERPVAKIVKGTDIIVDPPWPPAGPPPPPTEEIDWRMVYWIHGLNGDENGWLKPAEAFERGYGGVEARRIISQRIDYKLEQTVGNLESVASVVDKDLEIHPDLPDLLGDGKVYNPRSGIILAHSQGGVVSRMMDKNYSDGTYEEIRQKYGGIVTFGTPNQGAQLINNQEDVRTFLRLFSDEMSAGVIEELKKNDKILIRIISKKLLKYEYLDKLKDIFTNATTNYMIDVQYPPITEEYKVGAPQLDELNTYTPNETNLVAFYSIRDTLMYKEGAIVKELDGKEVNLGTIPVPISWATINYFFNAPSGEDYFKAQDNEYKVAGLAHQWYLDYSNRANYHYDRAEEVKEDWGIFGIVTRKKHEAKADAWQRGVTFLSGFDKMYRTFIGSNIYVPQENPIKYCECYVLDVQQNKIEELPTSTLYDGGDCEDHWEYLNSYTHEVHCNTKFLNDGLKIDYKPSDGVVLSESQMEIPQRTWDPQLIIGSTHMRMRNDHNTKFAVERIFDGDVGEFFETDTKE